MSKRVGIIGAGLSGLACGIELKKNGHNVKIFDSAPTVGGRIKTDQVEGFLFDHGFQVFLSSYEKAKYFLDYKKLSLKSFKPGAKLQVKNGFEVLSDPFRDFSSIFSTILNSKVSFKDKILVLKLKSKCKNFDLKEPSNQSTIDFLNEFGFSKKFVDSFFKPFFSGVFLESELLTDKNFFLYLFDKFNSSSAALPANGMSAIPLQMAENFSKEELSLSNSVISVGRKSIISEKDAVETFDEIVVAVSSDKVSRFIELPTQSFSQKMHSVSTYYYKTKSKNFSSKYLYLTQAKHINHVACLTAVHSGYAPEEENLFSVNVVDSQRLDSRFVTEDLKTVFSEEEIKQWEYLKSYHISKALPKKPQYGLSDTKINGVYLAGDYMQSPSIQGALESGYKVAKKIVES